MISILADKTKRIPLFLRNASFGLVIFFSFLSSGLSSSSREEVPDPHPEQSIIQHKIQSMTMEQKVGQLFIFGFQGTHFNKQLDEKMKLVNPGAIIMFKRNIKTLKQIAKLNSDIQIEGFKKISLTPFIMIDQEGGAVTRIKTKPNLPSALALGQSKDYDLIEESGMVTGQILSSLGFNFNLAPVADLSDPRTKNFIGNRSFGNDPKHVFNSALSFSKGLLSEKIIPTFKHFPGHGGINQDSHKVIPTNNKSKETLLKEDVYPFKQLTQVNSPTALMTAHVQFPGLDPEDLPATYSKAILTHLLRQELGYQGLVISDDLEMYGAKSIRNIGDRAIKALLAGVDMVMVAWSHNKQILAYNSVLNAVRTGTLPESLIDEKLYRIIKAKQFIELKIRPRDNLVSDFKRFSSLINEISKSVVKANFGLNFPENDFALERLVKSRKAYIYSTSYGFYKSLVNNLRPLIPAKIKMIPIGSKYPRPNALAIKQKGALGIFYVSGSGSARLLNSFPKEIKKNMLVFNGSYPGMLSNKEDFLAVIQMNNKFSDIGPWIKSRLESIKMEPLRTPSGT